MYLNYHNDLLNNQKRFNDYMDLLKQAIRKREDYDGDNTRDVVPSITGVFMYTGDKDYEFKIREINGSCVWELKNDVTTTHAKQKRIGAEATNFVEE